MEEAAYRRLKDAWFSNNTGSGRSEPFLVILPLALLIYFACAFRPRFGSLVFEYLLLVLPITVNLTFLAYNLDELLSKTISLWLICCCFKYFRTQTPLSAILQHPNDFRPCWITNFRASTNLVTIICILAVDLNIFPRKFAKTETYGHSLMDAGVGFYVISHGLVHKQKPWTSDLWDIAVLGALGILRTISVQSLDYHMQVSEYGVHWNFFWTLCVCRLISSILVHIPISNRILFIFSGLIHHLLTAELGDWVLSRAPRTNFFEANREGIVSAPGYVALFYAAAAYRDGINGYTLGQALKKTAKIVGILWVLGSLVQEGHVSRRLCNIGYISWILTLAFSFFLVLMIIDITLKWSEKPRVPRLLEMINRKGFLFFMVGNICTGIINLKIKTLLLSTESSFVLLIIYEIVVIFLTHVIRADTSVYYVIIPRKLMKTLGCFDPL